MTVAILTIADAVVTALNGATLSQSFTAARTYVPKFDPATDSGYQVCVVPKADSREPGGQSTDSAELQIDIGVMKKLAAFTTAAAELAEIDAALALCDEIRQLVNRHRLAGAEDAICTRIEQNPIYSVDHADEARTFLTVLTTTWITETAV